MRGAPGSVLVLLLAALLLGGGGLLGWAATTDFGSSHVLRLRVVGEEGRLVAARLHRPRAASPARPAPAVLLVHGDGQDAGALTPYAIEFARRGYVVLSIDRPGHGRSEPAASATHVGGRDAFATLRALPFVDRTRVVLVGHGTGGAVALAAARDPGTEHAAIVLLGAVPLEAEPGRLVEGRNVAVVLGRYDEFAPEVWGVRTAAAAPASGAMRALFGTPGPVVPGEIHGSVEDGTARFLALSALTHHGLLFGGSALAATIDWVQRTTPPPAPRPPNDQVWAVWALGAAATWLGFVVALFGISGALLGTRTFARVRLRFVPAAGMRALGWGVAALAATAVSALSYFWASERAQEGLARFAQPTTAGVLGWAAFNGAIALVGVLTWWAVAGRRAGARTSTLGLHVPSVTLTLGFALAVVGAAVTLLVLVDALFGVDARAWGLAVTPPRAADAPVLAVSVAVLVCVFAALGMLLHGPLRPVGARREGADAMVANALIAAGGLLVLLATQYVALFADGALPFGEALRTVLAIELAVVFGAAGALSTYLFARTGSILPGAWVNALWVGVHLVGGGALRVVA
jgi:dienelactone hydrolase